MEKTLKIVEGMYKAVDIAHVFVKKGILEGIPVTQMQLQKMVYFANGIVLHSTKGEKTLIKESFQAWEFGPVVPDLYREFKQFGSRSVTPDNDFLDIIGKGYNFDKSVSVEDANALSAIETTWEAMKNIDGITLSQWSHRPGSAWATSYKGVGNIPILNDRIVEEFDNMSQEA